jgi:hypothetical protein
MRWDILWSQLMPPSANKTPDRVPCCGATSRITSLTNLGRYSALGQRVADALIPFTMLSFLNAVGQSKIRVTRTGEPSMYVVRVSASEATKRSAEYVILAVSPAE